MAVKQHTCYTLHCDSCGIALDADDFIPHYDDPEQGLDTARDYEWTILRDGRVLCTETKCQLSVPACACPDEDNCDKLACPPGCPCLLHDQVEPLTPCEVCGEVFENHARRIFHGYRHEAPSEVPA